MRHRFSYWQRSDDAIADLKDEATQSGGAQKYAKDHAQAVDQPPHRSAGHEEEMAAGGVVTRADISFGGPPVKSSRPRREVPRYAGMMHPASLVLGAALVRVQLHSVLAKHVPRQSGAVK